MNEQNLQIKDLSISKDFSSSTEQHLRRVDVSLMNKNLYIIMMRDGRPNQKSLLSYFDFIIEIICKVYTCTNNTLTNKRLTD